MKQRIRQFRKAKHAFEEQGYGVAARLSPRSDRGVRACHLLDFIRSIEHIADKIPEPVLHDLLHDAILACGFSDEAEALRAVMTRVYPELLSLDGGADCAHEIKDTDCSSSPDYGVGDSD